MRVAVLHSSCQMYGSDRSLLSLAQYLVGAGHAVVVVVPEIGPLDPALRAVGCETAVLPFAVITRAMGVGGLVRSAREAVVPPSNLRCIIDEFSVDVVIANTSHIPASFSIQRRMGIPVVLYVREIERIPRIGRVALRHFWRLTTATRIYVSETCRRSYGLINRSDGQVIYNHIEVPHRHESRSVERSRVIHVVSLARITRWKGQDVLLRAIELLQQRGYQLTCDIFGEPASDDDIVFQAELLSLRDRLPHPAAVDFRGFVSDNQSALDEADVLAHTSVRAEPLGRSFLEAMATGCAVVASQAGGPSEMIEDRTTGLLVPAGDPLALCNALALLADDHELRARLATNAERMILTSLGVANTWSRAERVLEAVRK